MCGSFFVFKQKTAYEMRISDWSSDVCSSDLIDPATIERIIAACPTGRPVEVRDKAIILLLARLGLRAGDIRDMRLDDIDWRSGHLKVKGKTRRPDRLPLPQGVGDAILAYLAVARPTAIAAHLFLRRSEEHTSELQSLMRNSHAVFCFKKKN